MMKRLIVIFLLLVSGAFAQNPITVEVRHCQKYMKRSFPRFWHKKLTEERFAACQADSATLYGAGKTHNLRTNGGADYFNAQLFGTSAAGAQANYLAISTDSTAAAATDTSCTSELSTNGLGRGQATVTHAASAGSTLLQKSWTYSGSISVIINKVCLFTAVSGGTMTHEAILPAAPTVTNNGDAVTINYTISY